MFHVFGFLVKRLVGNRLFDICHLLPDVDDEISPTPARLLFVMTIHIFAVINSRWRLRAGIHAFAQICAVSPTAASRMGWVCNHAQKYPTSLFLRSYFDLELNNLRGRWRPAPCATLVQNSEARNNSRRLVLELGASTQSPTPETTAGV